MRTNSVHTFLLIRAANDLIRSHWIVLIRIILNIIPLTIVALDIFFVIDNNNIGIVN